MLKRLCFAFAALAVVSGGVWAFAADVPPDHALAPASLDQIINAAAPAPLIPDCDVDTFATAAQANAGSIAAMRWAPFGRAETGWEIYAPRIGAEIAATCAPDTAGFAQALADWQQAQGLAADGRMTPATFLAMKTAWQNARPFVAVRASGLCPEAPSEASLVRLSADEGYKGKVVMLRDDVAQAYRTMVSAARAETPELAADLEALDVFSGFRSPAYDDARCARDGNCGGVTRAKCSAHRTGYTFDLVVGAAPGQSVDSTNDANRLHMSRTPAYRWLVANGERFGFVNYVFEPWHWEYRGAPAFQPVDVQTASTQ